MTLKLKYLGPAETHIFASGNNERNTIYCIQYVFQNKYFQLFYEKFVNDTVCIKRLIV